MTERLHTSLQESVLTLLVMDDEKGQVAAGLVDLELFEPPYDDIARRALSFRRKFKKAPGAAHIDDIFDNILSNKKHREHNLYKQILSGILQQSKGLNADYTLSRVDDFLRQQNLKAALIEAGEVFQKNHEGVVAETEAILHAALKFRPQSLGKGVYLSDKKALRFLSESIQPDFLLGIKPLDDYNIGLTIGEALGFMAPKGRGKTWFCIHAATSAMMQGAKVIHISLEMTAQRIIPRYHRHMFAIGRNKKRYKRPTFKMDELGRVTSIDSEMFKPNLALSEPQIEKLVAAKMDRGNRRLHNIHFKHFPTGSLTMEQLGAYLDNLEATDGFVPNVMILDYPKLMKLDRRQDLRIALGSRMEELRGFIEERFMAGVFPFQSNRAAESAKTITGEHTGEDYSLTQTVDTLLTFTASPLERQRHFGRLYVEKARNEVDDFNVLVIQDYETGQFAKEAVYMPSNYKELMKETKEGSDD